MESPFEAIDAEQFFASERLAPNAALQGPELQKVFWRYKALEKELERQKAFWKSTNDTLSQAFLQVRNTERELQEKNQLLSESYQQLSELTNRLQDDLALARQIQQSLLPPRQALWSGPHVVCACIPAYEVGGDFYAYHLLRDQRFALAVGDVSDKGMSAALLMAISLAYFDSDLTYTLGPNELLGYLDRALVRYTAATRQNCALCYVELDGLCLRSVNAGGIPPFIRRTNGTVERLDVNGIPLGLGIGAVSGYQAISTMLAPNDLVILTSDGVVEANASTRNLFGFERLERAIAAGPASTPQAMLDYLMAEITAFVGDAGLHDDITIVVCQAA